jgi:hypothetical protein
LLYQPIDGCMTQETPKYFGTWQGKVLQAIMLHGNEPVNFNMLMEETGFHPKGLKMALAPLHQNNIIHYDGRNYTLIDEEIKKQWTKFLASNSQSNINSSQQAVSKSLPQEVGLIQWIVQWRDMRNLTFPLESKHFFLEGEYLDELARVLIGKAQKQVLVTNPFIDSCHLTKALETAASRKISVKAVARRPKNIPEDATKRECQTALKKIGMQIHYDNQIHAKVIVIDNLVAIVSSMNLYSASSGGFTKEAGIVSIDEKVVASVSKYIQDILSKPESTDSHY